MTLIVGVVLIVLGELIKPWMGRRAARAARLHAEQLKALETFSIEVRKLESKCLACGMPQQNRESLVRQTYTDLRALETTIRSLVDHLPPSFQPKAVALTDSIRQLYGAMMLPLGVQPGTANLQSITPRVAGFSNELKVAALDAETIRAQMLMREA